MTAPWQDVRCASIPPEALSVLADLRREPGIRVTIDRGRAWVYWEDGPDSEATRRILVERLLPMAGVEIFASRDGRWYRPGQRLPAFDVPAVAGPGGMTLGRAILPERLVIRPPGGEAVRPAALRVVRDDRQDPRPAAAARCRLGRLAAWAELLPSAWLASLSGAWCPATGAEGDPEVFLLGPAHRLPSTADAPRYWGDGVLIPLGHRADPELTDRALREAVGAGPHDLVVLDEAGPELIPRQALRPLDRASIRLAARARSPETGGRAP